MISADVERAMLAIAEEHYTFLLAQGCAEDIARDRMWDAYVHAFGEMDGHAFDARDRITENRLRTAYTRGAA